MVTLLVLLIGMRSAVGVVLPMSVVGITLAITNAAFYTRMVRGNMLETMTELRIQVSQG